MAFLDDIADYLTSQGHGANSTTTGTSPVNIFRNVIPFSPDTAIALFETGGLASVHAMASGPGQAVAARPSVQIRIRARSQDAARTLTDSVFNDMDGFRERTINGTRYSWMQSIQMPFLLDRDDEDREVFAFNMRVIKDL